MHIHLMLLKGIFERAVYTIPPTAQAEIQGRKRSEAERGEITSVTEERRTECIRRFAIKMFNSLC